MPTFAIGEQDFLLDGEPHRILSGALHYFRVHPDVWADRIHKARQLGLNTIETYVAWNAHSPERGVFDTDGQRDLGRFLDLVAAEGMHAIVRPGPYICAEWDNGGLPAWLMRIPGVGVRRNEPQYMAAVTEYLQQVLAIVEPRQITNGGPVVAVQIENEYGAYGDDKDYLRELVRVNREAGIEVPLLTCDQADPEMQARGSLPELHSTVTFGSRTAEKLAVLRAAQPRGPLMCMEFWNGWFDHWGAHHHVTDASAGDLDALLAVGGSVNLYMFHGGTNMGFTNGANDKGVYQPLVTSYDYDAPLAEDGTATAKYDAFREVISRYAPVPAESAPHRVPAPELTIEGGRRTVGLLDVVASLGEGSSWDEVPTHEDVAVASGFVRYRTSVSHTEPSVLAFDEVRDRAQVFLDGVAVGIIDRSERARSLTLPAAREGSVLDILVEDQGRVNYGTRIGEAKGLIGPATLAGKPLLGWDVLHVDVDALAVEATFADACEAAGPIAGPSLSRWTTDLPAGRDLFLDISGWGKGMVWVNGVNLGRYWSKGPTATMYVPGQIVTGDGDTVVLLELLGAPDAAVRFVAAPSLGHTEF